MFISLICVVTLLSVGCFTLVLILFFLLSVVGSLRSSLALKRKHTAWVCPRRLDTEWAPKWEQTNDVLWIQQNYELKIHICRTYKKKNPFIICSRSKLKSSSRDDGDAAAAAFYSMAQMIMSWPPIHLSKCREMKNSTSNQRRNSCATRWICSTINTGVNNVLTSSTHFTRVCVCVSVDVASRYTRIMLRVLYRGRSLCVFDCLCIILLLLCDSRVHILMLIAHSKQQISCLITYYTLHYKSIVFFPLPSPPILFVSCISLCYTFSVDDFISLLFVPISIFRLFSILFIIICRGQLGRYATAVTWATIYVRCWAPLHHFAKIPTARCIRLCSMKKKKRKLLIHVKKGEWCWMV